MVNSAGIELIKRSEGCRLQSYDDGFGTWTIGYGRTAGVRPGQHITQQEAERMLAEDLAAFGGQVAALCTLTPNPNQLGALTSLAYNIGVDNFHKSTVLKRHNAGHPAEAAEAFKMWNKAAGHVVPGLVRRRSEEAALYLTPVNGSTAPSVQTVDIPQPVTPPTSGAPTAAIGVAAGGAVWNFLAGLSPDSLTGWWGALRPPVEFAIANWRPVVTVIGVATIVLAVHWLRMRWKAQHAEGSI
jgi:lysozyme